MQAALVIDDNRSTADALSQMLAILGVPARVAYGSSPALAILRGFTPSLVTLDLNMPGLDGTEILLYLKREPRLTHVPVIVVTSDDQTETQRRVLAVGAAAVIVKPATVNILEETLKKVGILLSPK